MAEALALAEDARGRSAPNPNVGCAIVSGGSKIVGRGATAAGGRPHAEAVAPLAPTLLPPDTIAQPPFGFGAERPRASSASASASAMNRRS